LAVMEGRERETLSTDGGRAEEARLRLGIQKMGAMVSIYRERWNERRTIHLDLRAYHVLSSCLPENHAHAPLAAPSKDALDDGSPAQWATNVGPLRPWS
jgi:hypothetical protein